MSLKTIIKNLEKELDRLDELVTEREETFWDRSEKWQESEKGEEFEDKTNELDLLKGELDELIESLKEQA